MSADLNAMREAAERHATQIAAVGWMGVADLAARWGVTRRSVRGISRAALPYVEFGASKTRRYDPRDVEHFEQTAKHGEAA